MQWIAETVGEFVKGAGGRSRLRTGGTIGGRYCMPRPGKLNRGLSQRERTYGHGNSGSASQCECRGGGAKRHVSTFWSQKKSGN